MEKIIYTELINNRLEVFNKTKVLCAETVINIFSYLSYEDHYSFSRVCRLFYDIVSLKPYCDVYIVDYNNKIFESNDEDMDKRLLYTKFYYDEDGIDSGNPMFQTDTNSNNLGVCFKVHADEISIINKYRNIQFFLSSFSNIEYAEDFDIIFCLDNYSDNKFYISGMSESEDDMDVEDDDIESEDMNEYYSNYALELFDNPLKLCAMLLLPDDKQDINFKNADDFINCVLSNRNRSYMFPFLQEDVILEYYDYNCGEYHDSYSDAEEIDANNTSVHKNIAYYIYKRNKNELTDELIEYFTRTYKCNRKILDFIYTMFYVMTRVFPCGIKKNKNYIGKPKTIFIDGIVRNLKKSFGINE